MFWSSNVLKFVSLALAIMYSFTCIARACDKQEVSFPQIFMMGVSVSSFIFLQFILQ